MRHSLKLIPILALSFLNGACSMSTQKVDAQRNPAPKMRYEVTLTIENAPGPFDSITGFMQYEVSNTECVPETGGPMNPLRLAPSKNPDITFTKVAENVYKATVYGDYFQNEDYFGLGVCRWSLTAVTTRLKINHLTMTSSLPSEKLFSQSPSTRYFVRQDYQANDEERSTIGWNNPDAYPADRQKDIFVVTLSAKENFQ
jgi:hypothetical protein